MVAIDLRRTTERRDRLINAFADRSTAVVPDDEALDTMRVERCLNALAPRDRTLILLTFYAEKKVADIALDLQMAAGAVRVARHRALTRLRACVTGVSPQ